MRVQRRPPGNRPASASSVLGQIRKAKRLRVHVHARQRSRFAIRPLHLLRVDVPSERGAALQLANHLFAGANHGHARGERNAAAAGGGAIAGAVRVAHAHADAFVGNAQRFRCHQRHGGATAADVRAAFHHVDHAGIRNVNFGARLVGAVEPEPHGHAASHVSPQDALVVVVGFGGFQTFG